MTMPAFPPRACDSRADTIYQVDTRSAIVTGGPRQWRGAETWPAIAPSTACWLAHADAAEMTVSTVSRAKEIQSLTARRQWKASTMTTAQARYAVGRALVWDATGSSEGWSTCINRRSRPYGCFPSVKTRPRSGHIAVRARVQPPLYCHPRPSARPPPYGSMRPCSDTALWQNGSSRGGLGRELANRA